MKIQAVLVWGKNVDEPGDDEGGVPGVDKPLSPEQAQLLEGWG